MPKKQFIFIAVALIVAGATGALAADKVVHDAENIPELQKFFGYERGWIDSGSFDGSNMIRLDIGFMF